MRKFWLPAFLLFFGGIGAGFFSLVLTSQVKAPVGHSHWLTNSDIGTRGESIFSRALVARVGLYGLPKTEVWYFITQRDSRGILLEAGKRYQVRGIAPDCAFWSITLYDETLFLTENSKGEYHFNGHKLGVRKGETYAFVIDSQPSAEPWLPAPPKGPIVLCFRMYKPARTRLAERLLPKITPL